MTSRSDDLGHAILTLLDDEAGLDGYTRDEALDALAKATALYLVTERVDVESYIRVALRPMVEQARHAAVDLVLRPQDRKAGRGEA